MSNILVAYFSASGVTKAVAEKVAAVAGADIFEIVPKQIYTTADLDWQDDNSRSTLEMNDSTCRPEIASTIDDISKYSLIFVGFPIWWYREPSIIDTFMESYDFTGITVVPFCTSGGSGLGESAMNMQKLAKGAKVLSGRRFSIESAENIKDWVDMVRE